MHPLPRRCIINASLPPKLPPLSHAHASTPHPPPTENLSQRRCHMYERRHTGPDSIFSTLLLSYIFFNVLIVQDAYCVQDINIVKALPEFFDTPFYGLLVDHLWTSVQCMPTAFSICVTENLEREKLYSRPLPFCVCYPSTSTV